MNARIKLGRVSPREGDRRRALAGRRRARRSASIIRRYSAASARSKRRSARGLFERVAPGYQPTAAGEEMVALATRWPNSIDRVRAARRRAATSSRPGELRVTDSRFDRRPSAAADSRALPATVTPASISTCILASQHSNLSRRDADVAIRATNEPPETLVGRRIGADPLGGLLHAGDCHANMARDDGREAPWVGFGDAFRARRQQALDRRGTSGARRQVLRGQFGVGHGGARSPPARGPACCPVSSATATPILTRRRRADPRARRRPLDIDPSPICAIRRACAPSSTTSAAELAKLRRRCSKAPEREALQACDSRA